MYNYNSSERNMLMNNIPHATDRAAWECACGVGRDATSDGLAGPARHASRLTVLLLTTPVPPAPENTYTRPAHPEAPPEALLNT